MHKKRKGSFTLEASFILPVVLFLYLMIILAALFLYCRSAISQDNFLLAMRAGKYTWGESDYGEVIYGLEEASHWDGVNYVKERLERKRSFYPFFPTEEESCCIEEDWVWVGSRQKGTEKMVRKTLRRVNPVKIMRKWRISSNA